MRASIATLHAMTENTGASAKSRLQNQLASYGMGLLGAFVFVMTCFQLLMTIYQAQFGGIEVDEASGQTMNRELLNLEPSM
jgi:hypothetical protein